MLLTIDVGNTNTVLGVFRGPQLIANWRLTTAREQTVDEYGVLTRNLFTLAGLDRNDITGVIISSVVPPVNWTLGEMSRVYFGKKALFVEMGVKTGMAARTTAEGAGAVGGRMSVVIEGSEVTGSPKPSEPGGYGHEKVYVAIG